MLSAAVRAVVLSALSRPSKTSVLIRHIDGEYDAIDVDDDNRVEFIERLGAAGVPQDQARGLADALQLKAANLGMDGDATSNASGATGVS